MNCASEDAKLGGKSLRQEKENGTQAIERALEVLKCFMGDNNNLTLTAISKKVAIPVSTASRILGILSSKDFVQRNEMTKRYSLGKNIYLLGYCEKQQDTLRKVVYPYLVKLRDEFNETATMYVRDGTLRRLYEKVEPEKNFRFTPAIGSEYYLWAGAGAKTLLAFMQGDEREEILSQARALTPQTIIDKKILLEEILNVRKKGYASSFDEYSGGFTSLSGPVLNGKDQALCSIGVTGPSARFSPEIIEKLADRIKTYCMEISSCFGWPGPFPDSDWVFPVLGKA